MKRSLRIQLRSKLEPTELELLHTSYDVVGDIAIIRVQETLESQAQTIAQAILQSHRNIKTVLRQISPIAGDFRLRDLEWVDGEKRTETIHKEFGCFFKVDLERCYFSPRLSYERMRIAKLIQPNEVVVNMFAGVGCYSIIIAKHSHPNKIYSIDLNPIAFEFLKENARLNRVEKQVLPILGSAKETIEAKLVDVADRVIMPLPEKAYEYIGSALLALKSGRGIIHYYHFEHSDKGEKAIQKTLKKVSEKLTNLGINFVIPKSRIVRTTGPHWYQIVLDIKMF